MLETLNNNGNYVTITVSYRLGSLLPHFLLPYFEWYKTHSGGLLHLLQIVKHPEKLNGAYQFTLVLTIDEELSPACFEESMTAIFEEDIIPFFVGSKINPERIFYTYAIPEAFKEVATGGDIDVAIYGRELTPYLAQVLHDIFGFDGEQAERVGDMMEFIGEYRIQKCLKTEDKKKFDYIMNKFHIKYELYK